MQGIYQIGFARFSFSKPYYSFPAVLPVKVEFYIKTKGKDGPVASHQKRSGRSPMYASDLKWLKRLQNLP